MLGGRVMLRILIVIVILIFIDVNLIKTNETSSPVTFNCSNLKEIEDLNLEFCDNIHIVFDNLYDIVDVLPLRINDSTLVKEILLDNGFKIINYGSGNWEKGPRFTLIEYQKDSCKCSTLKIYYYNSQIEDSLFNMKVEEKIICNSLEVIKIE